MQRPRPRVVQSGLYALVRSGCQATTRPTAAPASTSPAPYASANGERDGTGRRGKSRSRKTCRRARRGVRRVVRAHAVHRRVVGGVRRAGCTSCRGVPDEAGREESTSAATPAAFGAAIEVPCSQPKPSPRAVKQAELTNEPANGSVQIRPSGRQRAERAPAAGEHIALAAVVAGDLVAACSARRGEVDPRAVVRVVGELVARADVVPPAQGHRVGAAPIAFAVAETIVTPGTPEGTTSQPRRS